MDAVILAGGRGSRLGDLVPEFYKPLVKVNGKALVVQAVEHACSAVDGKIVIVVAPQNAVAIDQAVPRGARISMVVQREANGPGEALLRGLEAVVADTAMVLLADNLMTRQDVLAVADPGVTAVAVREVPLAEAERFTRVMEDGTTREAEILREDEIQYDTALVWVGPLVVETQKARDVLAAAGKAGGEYKIGPWIPSIAPDFELVHVESCWDVGVPDALKAHGGSL